MDAKADETLTEDAVVDLTGPIVVLGDPGLGKSVLTQTLGSLVGNRYVRAGTFVRAHDPNGFLPAAGGRLVIDGLDEVASTRPGGGIHDVLRQLSAMGNPPFILSSREADWAGAAARVQIEDDYGEPVQVLRLQAFDRTDAALFLLLNFPAVDTEAVLDHLDAQGLQEIFGNPLTLRMIGEVAEAEEALPKTRSALLERACSLMLVEANQRHQTAPHTQQTSEALLLGAGAIAGALLLCDRIAAFTGPASGGPTDSIHLSAVASLPLAGAAAESLKTRLFQADGENRFAPIHRVVAEFLAARWLAAVVEAGASKRRILSLLTLGAGVPTSLRGVNAWLAHFSSILAPDCIAADPYAVLRYGDAETMPLDRAKLLLETLTRLSESDPYFREGGANRHVATGLLRVEMKDRVVSLITDEQAHPLLAHLLLEGLDASPLLPMIETEIEKILLDPAASEAARYRALHALSQGGRLTSPGRLVQALLDLGDASSNILAYRILDGARIDSVPPWQAAYAVLASAGITVSPILPTGDRDHHAPYIRGDIFEGVSAEFLHEFLGGITACAGPSLGDVAWRDRESAVTITRRAVVCLLEREPDVAAADVWRWLSWTGGYRSYGKEVEASLCDSLLANPELVRAIQLAVVSDTPLEDLRYRVFKLREVSEALRVDDQTLIVLMEAYAAQAGSALDLERLKAIALFGRSQEGLPSEISDVANRLAGGKRSFARSLAAQSKPFVDSYAKRRAKRDAAEEKKRESDYRKIRTQHRKDILGIRAGEFRHLNQDAKVYLGRFYGFDREAKPMERLEVLLGADLAEQAAVGFMASLLREDMPSAQAISESHAEGRYWNVEVLLVCGVIERLRRGLGLASLPLETLQAAYMAWRRQGESNTSSGVQIGPELEALVLADDVRAEQFFRTSIEPQLRSPTDHIYDLYKLTHEDRWRGLAGRLASEWLTAFPNLPTTVESELLDCAYRRGDAATLKALVSAGRHRVHANCDSLLNWLAMDFVADFARTQAHLAKAAVEQPDLLWRIRALTHAERHGAWPALSLAQFRFIVEAFAPIWPRTERPPGVTSGDTNRWDASYFIEGAAFRIAADSSAAATDALVGLLAGPDNGYRATLKHALAEQRKLRRDNEYNPATLQALQSVTDNGPPSNIDDMRAFFGDRVTTVIERMHATNTDMWEAYWNGEKPRDENFCRNRLIEHISAALPATVRFEPEMHMPGQTRADIAAIRDSVGLPVEIKGQWHSNVWDAASTQLKASYARDWHAEGRGAYIVLWFGDAPGKQLTTHPEGLDRPTAPAELRAMLIDRIPEADRDLFDIYVVDVSRPD